MAPRTLDAARAGDEHAFRELVQPHRAELHAHCYRMLGSLHDAEDALQDALLRAWRGLGGIESHAALRRWLYRIATNTCLDLIAKRPKRVLSLDAPSPGDAGPGEPLVENVWIEPYPDGELGLVVEQRESVELAFIVALQHLPARQRAVLILREVLGFSAQEVAESLDTTPASVNSALQRARQTVDERLPARSQQATLRSLGDEGLRALVGRYVDAWESGDMTSLVAVLAEDVTFAMPPFPRWFRGRGDVLALFEGAGGPSLRSIPAQANGQAAIGWYMFDTERGAFLPSSVEVLTVEGLHIGAITAFVSPEWFAPLGLPPQADW